MSPLSKITRDVRALGTSAPLRAVYEASKRSDFHRVLFRQSAKASGHRSQPIRFATSEIGAEARARCLADAEAVRTEGTRVFGRRVPTGVTASWHQDPFTGESWPGGTAWWRIDIRTDDRLSDVKFVWEAARHRDLVVLARAAHLDPDGPWLGLLVDMLRRWCRECAPETGVNWYSSLELALRAIAWNQVLDIVGDRLPDELRADMDVQLIASGRHIMIELPYTVSSMKNNHLLGDGLGLVVLGRMFPAYSASRRWQRIGDRLFHAQLRRHMHLDGSMIEDSLSYHRFVLEMLVVRVLLGDASEECRRALEGASQHLERLGVLAGDVPQYGDWDEGRVLADSAPAGSVRGSALAGLALSGFVVAESAWTDHDELAWYVPRSGLDAATSPAQLEPLRRAGDFQIIEHGPWRIWFKVAGGRSHQHADISAVWIQRDGQWVTRDPGTGTYNGPLNVRNGFRTSSAHPVWCPAGDDQLGPHRAFRWLRTVRGYATPPRRLETTSIAFGWHDAFVNGPLASKVGRAIAVSDDAVLVVDFIERPGGADWMMTVPLGDGELPDLIGLRGAETLNGSRLPFAGWHSDTYGSWRPSDWLASRLDRSVTAWGFGAGQTVDVDDTGCVTLNDQLSISLTWREHGATLRLSGIAAEELVEVFRD